MSLLLPDSGLLFWMTLTFGIVFVVLAKFGFPVITKMVEGRKLYIDQSLAVAKEANEQIAKLKQENATLIANANKEQGRIIKEAMQERDKIIAQAQQQAKIAAQKELDEVKERIRQEKEEAIRSIRRQVASLSVDIAEKVIRKQLDDEKEQMGMIDRMLDDALAAAKAN
ncbi:MAG: F0F1 ATP synthase subunit B [Mediterranea sp.]|jgi:F-type H+-transporting ATPase subunit b|nr:F0F1 ATP synthase subunit B [Mediterranea sp.]